MEKHGINNLDLQIISLLLKNSKIPYKEMSKKLNVSLGTIHVRIKKLEELQVIRNYTMDIDFLKLNLNLTAFIGLIINTKAHDTIVKQLKEIPNITELHHTTGGYHMLAKIVCKSTTQLREILINKINSIEGIEKTETTISLAEIISNSYNFII